ncbi:MAG: MFS transporter [Lysobacterales bacterium]
MKPLLRVFNVRAEEARSALYATAFFFCVLAALMLLRPARDALGMQRGIESVRWLFVATSVITLLVNPVFGWLVARYRRLRVLLIAYGFFALGLLAFYALLAWAPAAVGERSGQVFYVWFSVFNFFATMLFWALMADSFTLEQGKRLFPLVSAGGTLGAIAGPALTALLAERLGTPALLLVAIGFIALAGLAAGALARRQPPLGVSVDQPMGGSALAGITALLRSRYLIGIAGYVLILSVMVTFLYFTRLQMVAALGEDLDMRTGWLARMDMATQIATLLLQLVLAGRLIERIGLAWTLALLPLTTLLGFIGLALVATLTMLVLVEAGFRAVQRAVQRPAREVLFTIVPREDKYKAKAVIDTFVYRMGDVAGAGTEGALSKLALGLGALAATAVPLAVAWAALGLWLGRKSRAPQPSA